MAHGLRVSGRRLFVLVVGLSLSALHGCGGDEPAAGEAGGIHDRDAGPESDAPAGRAAAAAGTGAANGTAGTSAGASGSAAKGGSAGAPTPSAGHGGSSAAPSSAVDAGVPDDGDAQAQADQPRIPGAACDVVEQSGCGAIQGCKFIVTASSVLPACVPYTFGVAAPANYDCAQDSDCRASNCVSGLCVEYCEQDSDCGPQGSCDQVLVRGVEVAGFKVCSSTCDPVDPAPVSGDPASTFVNCGAYCVAGSERGVCIENSAPDGYASEGDSCELQSDCASSTGLGCLDGTCAPWCRSDGDCSTTYPICDKGYGRFARADDEIGFCIAMSTGD